MDDKPRLASSRLGSTITAIFRSLKFVISLFRVPKLSLTSPPPQAAVICCFLSYSAARFGEVWLECAQATRLAVPMGLNHLRSNPPLIGTDWSKQTKTSMLPATNDEDELFERSVTFWFGEFVDGLGE